MNNLSANYGKILGTLQEIGSKMNFLNQILHAVCTIDGVLLILI